MIAALARLIVSPCSKRPGSLLGSMPTNPIVTFTIVSPNDERRAVAQLRVDERRRDPVGVEPGERPEERRQRARRAVRIARGVEVGAFPPEQRERHRADHRVDQVALLEQMPDARDAEQPERRLPGAVAAAREAAPEQHEAERGRDEHAVGDVGSGRAEQLGDDLEAPCPGGRDHGDETGEARGCGNEREQERCARGDARAC